MRNSCVNAIKKCFCLFLLSMTAIFSVPGAFAEYDEEMSLLGMYFSEDELVVTSTRNPKPLSQVAENISIVTAEDIENMNAHSVGEVLDMVTGLFLDFQGHDFAGGNTLNIQLSEVRHVLILLDGMPYNVLEEGKPLTQSIPVMIIKRIEIIKGPASSTWGSSLGGVINIITKDAGDSDSPSGTVSASYGKSNSQDYRAEAAGRAGRVGYYLFVGRLDSDGLNENRFFESNMFYSKIDIPLHSGTDLIFTAGYSKPEFNVGDSDRTWLSKNEVFYTTATFTSEITKNLDCEASLNFFSHYTDLISGYREYDNEILSGNSILTWKRKNHTLVTGIDLSDGDLESVYNSDDNTFKSSINRYAIFANDTVEIGDFTLTPGIRYDYDDITESFVSPSLGATFMLSNKTLFRATVARGFTRPPAGFLEGGGPKLDPNPDLKSETVWSYQTGVETYIQKYVKAKVNAFYHDADNSLYMAENPESGNNIFINTGSITREGAEIELETASFYNISLKTGFTCVFEKNQEQDTTEDRYAANVALRYDDMKSFMAMLAGSYMDFDTDINESAEDGMLWDLNLRKKVNVFRNIKSDIFFTANNIFDAKRFILEIRQNPGTWIEGGLRMKF